MQTDETTRSWGDEMGLPMRCNHCHRLIYYDYADERYHHLDNPKEGCFLIPPEDQRL